MVCLIEELKGKDKGKKLTIHVILHQNCKNNNLCVYLAGRENQISSAIRKIYLKIMALQQK